MNVDEIILIEDNRHDIEMILDAFGEQCVSNKICVFRDGAEALGHILDIQERLLGISGAPPKLIILDMKLPKVSGIEILKCIKSNEKTKYIPTVVFTSSDEPRDRQECYLLGTNSYVVKPLDADRFSQYVKNIGSYWLLMNETLYE